MSDIKGDSSKPKRSKAEKAAAAAERRQRKAEELQQRRNAQLHAAEAAVRKSEGPLRDIAARAQRRKVLADHLQSFYVEVDKFAKNRQLEATTLVVDQANDIIRDAKTIVSGDPYLERVNVFVPAGENPPYADVLMVAATIRAALRRAESALEAEDKRWRAISHTALTIAAAVRVIIESGEPYPTRNAVATAMGDKPESVWFFKADDDEVYFNSGKLDATDLEALFAGADED